MTALRPGVQDTGDEIGSSVPAAEATHRCIKALQLHVSFSPPRMHGRGACASGDSTIISGFEESTPHSTQFQVLRCESREGDLG